jgi:serine/threonine protein kinase
MADQGQCASGLGISPDEIERAMTGYFGAGQNGQASKGYSEKDVQHISKLLEHLGKKEWSLRPRTYIVLRHINCTEIMPIFVSLGLFDIALPYNHTTLPEAITSPSTRMRFLETQLVVLTKAMDLETFEGRHRHFSEDGDLHFKRIKSLGQGGFGEVDHVYSTLSCKEYARKRIFRGRTFKKNKQKMEMFENELSTLKRLSHHHLVEYIGSYTDKKFFGLIMSPIADMNLKEFLNISPFSNFHQSTLRTFFGCISSGVLYLHRNQIRHKDIKPENILVKGENVLITDFGTALDWAEQGHSTTDNTIKAWSVRYCAPEVANYQKRNSSADIWSLACVFFEMITVLRGQTIQAMREYFSNHGTEEAFIRDNADATHGWMQLLYQNTGPSSDNEPLEWVRAMTRPVPRDRIGAAELVSRISEYRTEGSFIGLCCTEIHDADEDSDSSYQGSADEREGSHILTAPTTVQDSTLLESSSHESLDASDQPLSPPQIQTSSEPILPNVARFPIRDEIVKEAQADSSSFKRQLQSLQQSKATPQRLGMPLQHDTNASRLEISSPAAKTSQQPHKGQQDWEIHQRKPSEENYRETILSSSEFPPLDIQGSKVTGQKRNQPNSWGRLIASDDAPGRIIREAQGSSERDHSLDTCAWDRVGLSYKISINRH